MAAFFNLTLSFSFFFFFLLPYVKPLTFKMNRFSADSNLLLEGAAVYSRGTIELINRVDYLWRVGRATYADRVMLWDSNSGKLSDFTSHFTFAIDTLGRSNYSSGLAFFLAPVGFPIPPNSTGGFLGLFNTSSRDPSHNGIVMVEFDSFPNPEWDPPFEHVGINHNSIASIVTTPWNASLHSGDIAEAYVTYNSSSKNLSVIWYYGGNLSSSRICSCNIDLRTVLPEWVNIGFSAATNDYAERNIIFSWEFNSTLATIKAKRNISNKFNFVAHPLISAGILISGTIIVIMILKRRRLVIKDTAEKVNLTSIYGDLESEVGPIMFSYNELRRATYNFSNKSKLCQRGFGEFYKGSLPEIGQVAVKKTSRDLKQGKREYSEQLNIISQLRHPNLVQLIGWCHNKREVLLVYEFMPNGSLDAHLFGEKDSLPWDIRYRIVRGLASALLHLHEGCGRYIIHGGIKPSNIMLDSRFNAKLGDFDLASFKDNKLTLPTEIKNLGYIAPEWFTSGWISRQSDVFSFGVVVLEIASGRKVGDSNDEKNQVGLVLWVWDLYRKGELLSAVEGRSHTDFDAKEAEWVMTVGLWCAHPDFNVRPSIREAIQVLDYKAAFPNLQMTTPFPTYHVPTRREKRTGRLAACLKKWIKHRKMKDNKPYEVVGETIHIEEALASQSNSVGKSSSLLAIVHDQVFDDVHAPDEHSLVRCKLPSATPTNDAQSWIISEYQQRVNDAEARTRTAEENFKKLQLEHAETRARLDRQEAEMDKLKEMIERWSSQMDIRGFQVGKLEVENKVPNPSFTSLL